MRFITRTMAAIVAIGSAQVTAHAHFVWATIANGQARFALLENVNESPSTAFEKYVTGLSPRSGGGKTLPDGTVREGARYATLPAGQNVVVAESIVGVKDRDGETYLLIYNAKGASDLASAQTLTKAPAELLIRREGQKLVVAVRQNGWPVPRSEVWVQYPGDATATGVTTDAMGEAELPDRTATARSAGFVGIRALVNEAKSGESEGKRYPAIHRWATLTFPVEAIPVGAPKEDKPFTQILRASFGKNHEVVSEAAFNQTLFAAKLTKAQLIIHLQQRALIHNELHRILIAASPDLHIPYGAAQKNVLVLLFSDLITLGSGWPTEAQARPLTQSFLEQIRASEKNGPYFALGVQHVYFGGITNGGRMIGEKIGETLKFTPSYYEKSDGYPEYLVEVNKITDPAARQEMIRGGQAAYQYIIASSNEAVFK